MNNNPMNNNTAVAALVLVRFSIAQPAGSTGPVVNASSHDG
jgi:hypothetical protein